MAQKEYEKEDADSEAEAPGVGGPAAGDDGSAAAKKRKKKKKKSGSGGGEAKALGFIPHQDNSAIRRLGDWPQIKPSQQTEPPTKTMQDLFPDGVFPKGMTV